MALKIEKHSFDCTVDIGSDRMSAILEVEKRRPAPIEKLYDVLMRIPGVDDVDYRGASSFVYFTLYISHDTSETHSAILSAIESQVAICAQKLADETILQQAG
jgi:hypothetical protein